MGPVVYNAANLRVARYYFTGDITLQAGQPLCFQPTPASSTKGFPFDVELPGASNLLAFAGIVHPSSAGVVGPAFIDVIVPQSGDILQVFVGINNNTTVSVGDLLQMNSLFGSNSTATSGRGAFWRATDAYGASVTFASNATSAALSALAAGLAAVRCRALESQVSTDSSANRSRSLKWVQFI